MELSECEAYVQSKGLRYGISNGEINIYECPFCHNADGKFYINSETWKYTCHRGSCGVKGAKSSFMKQLGDTPDVEQSQRSSASKKDDKVEPIPDVEAMHQALLERVDVLNWLNDERGFSAELIAKMKLGVGKRNLRIGGEVREVQMVTFPYFEAGKCTGVKYRSLPQSLDPNAPKEKFLSFTKGRDVGIYNHDAIVKDMELLIICEGEPDTLSMLQNGYTNVVGISGCKGKKADWAHMLDLPKKIVLIYDNDEIGQQGAYDFALRFGMDKISNAILPTFTTVDGKKGKDVNEWWLAVNQPAILEDVIAAAKPFDIEGAYSSEDVVSSIIKRLDNGETLEPRFKFHLEDLNKKSGGYDRSQMILLVAEPGAGKTTLALNIAHHHTDAYGENVLFECPEMPPENLVKKLACYLTGTPDSPGENNVTREVLLKAQERINENQGRIVWGYPKGIETLEQCDKRLRALIKRYDIKLLVYDNLHQLVSVTLAESSMAQRTAYINKASAMFRRLTNDTGVTTLLICQPRGLAPGQVVSIEAIDGAQGPKRDCDWGLSAHRNKEANMKADELDNFGFDFETEQNFSPKMFLRVEKPRYGPGGVCVYYFDGATATVRKYTKEDDASSRGEKVDLSNDPLWVGVQQA